jgi:hypothetical protein
MQRIPWTLFPCIGFSVLVFLLPVLFNIEDVAVLSLRVAGVLGFVGSMLALSQRFRALRFLNFAAGGLLVCWFFGQAMGADRWIAFALGNALILFSLYSGKHCNVSPCTTL